MTAPKRKESEAVTEVMKKQKRKRPDLSEMFSPQLKPDEMSALLTHAYNIRHWPDIDTDDPEQVAERIDQYHKYCIQNGIKPDMAGLAMAFGVSRKTLWAWENGVESNKPLTVRNILKRGRQVNEFLLTQMMLNNKIIPASAIFLLKNSHEYKDTQDVVITPNNPMESEDPEQARKKYLEGLPEAEN